MLDAAVARGNAILREFYVINGAAHKGRSEATLC